MILEARQLFKSFKQGENFIEVLKGTSFGVSAGETVAVLGKSGSGKSTLLSLLCGIDRPNEGEVFYGKKSLNAQSEDELAKMRVEHLGVIFQQFHLVEHLSALENVSLPLDILGKSNSEKAAIDVLRQVGMGHRLNHYPSQLSGGERQRVAIARSLVTNPQVLLADEPSGSLDEATGDEVMDLIFNLVKENNTALILVTHDKELSLKCGRQLLLEDGVLRSDP